MLQPGKSHTDLTESRGKRGEHKTGVVWVMLDAAAWMTTCQITAMHSDSNQSLEKRGSTNLALNASLCSRCQATHRQQPSHRIERSCLIRLKFFRLWIEAYLVHFFLYWLSHRLITRGQACGWQQTRDTRYVARISYATQIPRAALFVSTSADDRRRTSIYRSQNPAQGLWRSHRGICRRMPKWTLWITWSVFCSVPR